MLAVALGGIGAEWNSIESGGQRLQAGSRGTTMWYIRAGVKPPMNAARKWMQADLSHPQSGIITTSSPETSFAIIRKREECFRAETSPAFRLKVNSC